jgi:hypothetical protein
VAYLSSRKLGLDGMEGYALSIVKRPEGLSAEARQELSDYAFVFLSINSILTIEKINLECDILLWLNRSNQILPAVDHARVAERLFNSPGANTMYLIKYIPPFCPSTAQAFTRFPSLP